METHEAAVQPTTNRITGCELCHVQTDKYVYNKNILYIRASFPITRIQSLVCQLQLPCVQTPYKKHPPFCQQQCSNIISLLVETRQQGNSQTLWLKYFSNLTRPCATQSAHLLGSVCTIFATVTPPSTATPLFNSWCTQQNTECILWLRNASIADFCHSTLTVWICSK